ncbi:carbohydrate kinase family protein [Timonella sp. A28]|uniref:carbohydrate kinase family protein n=1 Tax=Timonella sp. A28 TaxID=3442640 RepID=UPI003EBD9BA5
MIQSAGHCLIIGEALIDAVHSPDGTTREHPGGSPANVALTLGRLGCPATLLTWLGDDEQGSRIAAWLSDSHVMLSAHSSHAKSTSVAHARVRPDGSADYDFDITWDLPDSFEVPADTVVVHTGSIAAVLQPGGRKVKDIIAGAQPTATITYDPNIRPSLMGNPEDTRLLVEDYVGLSDVVKVSDEDLRWLYPDADIAEVAQRWLALGPAFVVVTLGGSGAQAFTRTDTVSVTAPRVQVVDTVGAGDSFMGALIASLREHNLLSAAKRQQLHAISTATLETVLTRCINVAAVTVSRAGANPPRLTEIVE